MRTFYMEKLAMAGEMEAARLKTARETAEEEREGEEKHGN
jgi:hypothetical protein